jgi:aconitase A
VAQNFLSQPALVVAYAIAGTVDVDLDSEPLGHNSEGAPVYLKDLWPTNAMIDEVLGSELTADLYAAGRAEAAEGSDAWREIPSSESATFPWDEASTYVRRAPYFDLAVRQDQVSISGARALALLGDFVTTDHISPAGSIAKTSPAARYLRDNGVAEADFNTYGARRGNHEVMMRGTFANVRLENLLAQGRKGGWTLDQLDGNASIKVRFNVPRSRLKDTTAHAILAIVRELTGNAIRHGAALCARGHKRQQRPKLVAVVFPHGCARHGAGAPFHLQQAQLQQQQFFKHQTTARDLQRLVVPRAMDVLIGVSCGAQTVLTAQRGR